MDKNKAYILIFLIIIIILSTGFLEYAKGSDNYLLYGNYCGLGGSGEAIDDIDVACRNHDDCYEQNQIQTGFFFIARQLTGLNKDPEQISCDLEFCDSLISVENPTNRQKIFTDMATNFFKC